MTPCIIILGQTRSICRKLHDILPLHLYLIDMLQRSICIRERIVFKICLIVHKGSGNGICLIVHKGSGNGICLIAHKGSGNGIWKSFIAISNTRIYNLVEKMIFSVNGERAFSRYGLKLWNKLALHVRMENDTNKFKKLLKSYLMTDLYSYYCCLNTH